MGQDSALAEPGVCKFFPLSVLGVTYHWVKSSLSFG